MLPPNVCHNLACLESKIDHACNYTEDALAYRMICETYTPYSGDDDIYALHKYGKLTIEKLKSSRLS